AKEVRRNHNWYGVASGCSTCMGPPRVHGRIRCEEADQIARDRGESRIDQSAFLDSRRREECRRNHNALDGRRRYAEHTSSARFDQEGSSDRRRNPSGWVPGERRHKPREWPRSDLPRWKKDIPGIVWSGRTAAGRSKAVARKRSPE